MIALDNDASCVEALYNLGLVNKKLGLHEVSKHLLLILGDMVCTGVDSEVNGAYIVAGTRVIEENFTSVQRQYKSTMLSPICLRAATRVLCPEVNGARHCALAVHRAVLPREDHMSLCIPS